MNACDHRSPATASAASSSPHPPSFRMAPPTSPSSTLLWWGVVVLLPLLLLSLYLLYSLATYLLNTGIDRLCAYLHYRTTRLKLSLRPRRLILIRHGESQGNVDKGCYQHIPDNLIQLTGQGREQAREAGRRLRELIGDESVLFYVSPFLRSQQTFHIISESFREGQYRVREDPRIREQEWGNSQQPAAMADIMAERERVGRFFYRFQDGESGADVFDRVSSFMESMFREMGQDIPAQNMVLVSHGLFMRLFLTRFYRWSVERFTHLANPHNGEFYVLEREDKFAGFSLKSHVRTYEDKATAQPDAHEAAEEEEAEKEGKARVDDEGEPTDGGKQQSHAEERCAGKGEAQDEAEGKEGVQQQVRRRSPMVGGSRTQPLTSDIPALPSLLPPSCPTLRPCHSSPPPRHPSSHPSLLPRLHSAQPIEHDAFSPRLTSQSLLAASPFAMRGEFSLQGVGGAKVEKRRRGSSRAVEAKDGGSRGRSGSEGTEVVAGRGAEDEGEGESEGGGQCATLRSRRPIE